jgi:hypothetical protein
VSTAALLAAGTTGQVRSFVSREPGGPDPKKQLRGRPGVLHAQQHGRDIGWLRGLLEVERDVQCVAAIPIRRQSSESNGQLLVAHRRTLQWHAKRWQPLACANVGQARKVW